MISMLVTFWGSMSVLSSRVKMYKNNAATGAVWTVSGSVLGCRKKIYNVNSNDHRSTKFELLLYKEARRWQGAAWAAGAQERPSTSISMEHWGEDYQDVSQREPESSHHGNVGGILEEESIMHTVYTAPWSSTPAFSSDILTLKDGTNKLSWNVCTKLPTTLHNILQYQRPFTSVCQIWFHFEGRLYLKMFKKIFRYEMDEAGRQLPLALFV